VPLGRAQRYLESTARDAHNSLAHVSNSSSAMVKQIFTGERKTFLLSFLDQYTSHREARTVGDFWPVVIPAYLTKFPEDDVVIEPSTYVPCKTKCGKPSRRRADGQAKPLREVCFLVYVARVTVSDKSIADNRMVWQFEAVQVKQYAEPQVYQWIEGRQKDSYRLWQAKATLTRILGALLPHPRQAPCRLQCIRGFSRTRDHANVRVCLQKFLYSPSMEERITRYSQAGDGLQETKGYEP
jgi:hypothetical protein